MPGMFDDLVPGQQVKPAGFGMFADLVPPKDDTGDFMRGTKVALGQTVPILKGVVGLAGATAESAFGEGGISTGIKNWGLKGYQEDMQKLAPLQRDTDELTTAWDRAKQGDLGALVDWAQYGLGYAVGQGGEALAASLLGATAGAALAPEAAPVAAAGGAITGLVAKGAVKEAATSLIEKAVLKEANRLMAESGGKMAAEQATKEATKAIAKNIGSTSALLAYGTGQELGSIYPEAEAEALKKGEKLTGSDLARIWATGLAAGGIEGLTDKLGVDVALGRVKLPGVGGRAANAALQGIGGAAVEGGTEALQTAIERYGAGQDILSDEGVKDIINSAGLGAIGGGAIGGGVGALRPAQQQEPKTPEKPPAPVLQLGNTPDPFIVFPDGTTGKRSELEAYINGLPEDQRLAARAKLLGLGEQPGTPPAAAPVEPGPLDFDKAANYLPEQPKAELTTSLGAAPPKPTGGLNFDVGDIVGDILSAGSVDEAIKLADVATDVPTLPGGRTLEKDLAFMRADADKARAKNADLDRIPSQAAEQDAVAAALARAATFNAPTPMQLALQRAREAQLLKSAPAAPEPVTPMPVETVAPTVPTKPEPRTVPADGLFLMTRKGAERRAELTGGELVQAVRSNGKMGWAVLQPQQVTPNEQDPAAPARGTQAQAQPQAPTEAAAVAPAGGAARANLGEVAGGGIQAAGLTQETANARPDTAGTGGRGPADLGTGGGTGGALQGPGRPGPAGPAVRDADPSVDARDDGRGRDGALTPELRVIARVGRTPNSASPVELHRNADGTLTPVMEGAEMLDFDSGEPIKLPANVTDEEAKAAIRKAGAVSSKQNFYAVKPGEQAPSAVRRSVPKVNPEQDTLLQAVAKMGGINRDELAREFGMKPEELKTAIPVGNLKGYPFRKTGGMSIDRAAEALTESGYFDGVPADEVRAKLEEAIYGELGGSPRLSTLGQMRQANERGAQDAAEQQAQAAEEFPEADRQELKAIESTTEGLQYLGRVDDDVLPDMDAPGQTDPAAIMRALGFTEQEIADDLADQAARQGGKAQAGSRPGQDATGPAPTTGATRSEAPQSDAALSLTAPTPEDLRAKAGAEAKARAADQAEQKRLADKAAADAQRDEFTLTGSDSPADVAAAAGQGGLFDAPVERFEAGKALTKAEREQVLSSLVDVYKAKSAPREQKGVDRNGNEKFGYVHSPELFEKSDITGAMVRYYVTLPDGRRAHPTELFPDYTQSDIDAEMAARDSRRRDRQSDVLRATVPAQQFSTIREAVAWWDKRSHESTRTASGQPTIFPSEERRPLTDGRKFILVPNSTSGELLEAFADAGWRISRGGESPRAIVQDAQDERGPADVAAAAGQGGLFDSPAKEAANILDAAEVTGKERIDALKDIKAGTITTEELKDAYPAKIGTRLDDLDAKFSAAADADKNLIITHNLTAQNLLHAVKMGGIPVPSLAVTKKDNPLTGFGEITLIGDSNLADPKGYAGTKVYGADIYSPRYPSVTFEFTPNMRKRGEAILRQAMEATGQAYIEWSEVEKDGPREFERNTAFLWKFLTDKGLTPDVKRTEVKPLSPEMMPFAEGNLDRFDLMRDETFIAAAWKMRREFLLARYEGNEAETDAEMNAERERVKERGQFFFANDLARQIENYRRDLRENGKIDRDATRRALQNQVREADLSGELEAAARQFVEDLSPNERIFQGFTPSGRRRYIPHTLENVVKILKKELRGGESFNYGVGSLRAKFTPEFKTLAAIKKEKGRLVSAEEFEPVKKEVDDELVGIATELGLSLDQTIEVFEDAPKIGVTRAIDRAIRDYNSSAIVDEEIKQRIAQFLTRLRNLPTAYFEAKILRDVSLSEFKAAVVPEGSSREVVDALKKAGIADIKTYERGNDASRAAAIQSFEDLRFSRRDAMDSVAERVQNQADEPANNSNASRKGQAVADPQGQRDADAFARGLERGGFAAVLKAVRADPERADQRAAEAIAGRLFKKRVVWVEFGGKPLFHGARFGGTPDVIFLWAGSKKPAHAVVGHELLHALRADNPKAYADLLERLKPQLQNENVFRNELARKDPRAAQDADVTLEELVGDIVGDHFTEPEFWADLGKAKPEGFRAIVDAVVKFLNKIITRVTLLRPFGSEQYLRDLKQSREAVADAMRAYSEERGRAAKDDAVSFSAAGQTDSAAFKRWFGESVVTESGRPGGKPLVVYHGTTAEISAFQQNKATEKDAGWYGRGIYFTADPDTASTYSRYEELQGKELSGAPRVMPVYVSIQNPYVWPTNRRAATTPEEAAAIRKELEAQGHDGVIVPNEYADPRYAGHYEVVAFRPEQIKSAIGNNGDFDPKNPDIRFSMVDHSANSILSTADAVQRLIGAAPKAVGETGRKYTAKQREAMDRVGFGAKPPTASERIKAIWQDAGKKLAQGLADQFAPVKELSMEAYGLLRLSKGASGAFEAMLQGGKLKLTDGVYDFDESQRGGVVDRLLKPLGGEHHDFFRWVAANRAERLLAEGRENLFTREDIDAIKSLSSGVTDFDYTIQHGIRKGQTTRDRTLIYPDALKTFNEFQNNVLDMAEQSGLIDSEARKLWQAEFYVPFYRVTEDNGVASMNIKGGVVRQQAFKQLKGGKDQLNADLLDNTLMNWAHLLDASAKNRAAKATLEAAERMGAAIPANESTARELGESINRKNGVVWFMDGGAKRFYLVDDPYLLTAINALEYAGMRGPVMDAMSKFKHALTVGVTASPFFKVRNLIRDSVQVLATSKIDVNPIQNIKEGWKATDPKSDEYFRLLAGGGTIHFGTMYEGAESKRVQQLVEAGVDKSTILDSPSKIKAFCKKAIKSSIDAYNELGNRGEAINRASLYKQLKAQGMSHAEASLQARDLMDFSLQGSFSSIRFLSQVVPFLNARIQGLYKLGRAAKEDPQRFAAVVGAATVASLALLVAYGDDEDWKKREEWDRDNYWWFKIGGIAYRIPKPFEVGAIGTLAERSFEYAFDKEMDGKRFRERVLSLVGSNLSMNPIPQLVKPALDVYANVDSFTGRPIESMAMQRLKSEYRFNNNTSMAARAISTAANAVTGTIGKESLSPVQVDQLLRGYFGWLGTFVVSVGDILARPATNQPERAAPDYWKAATGGMVANLENAPSRYVSQMYAQAREVEAAYATWKDLLKDGKVEEAKEFREDNADAIKKYGVVERIKKRESELSARIRQIEESTQPGDTKREMIRSLRVLQDSAARQLARFN